MERRGKGEERGLKREKREYWEREQREDKDREKEKRDKSELR